MNKYKLKSGKVINIKVVQGDKPAHWNPSGLHYKITMKINNKSHMFDFWDSLHNKIEYKPCDIRGALACFGSDSLMGVNMRDALDIMDEFGMDDTKEARRIYNSCKKSYDNSVRIGLDEEDLQELSDY